MTKKIGRNDPCHCGSGKKYKNCHMQQDQESTAAKYTASGKRKFKAKVISAGSGASGVFARTPVGPQAPPAPDVLQKLKFRMTKNDFRQEEPPTAAEMPFVLPKNNDVGAMPQERELNLPNPNEPFKPATEDFRSL